MTDFQLIVYSLAALYWAASYLFPQQKRDTLMALIIDAIIIAAILLILGINGDKNLVIEQVDYGRNLSSSLKKDT